MLMKKQSVGRWKSNSWYEQFTRAFTVEAGDDDEEDEEKVKEIS